MEKIIHNVGTDKIVLVELSDDEIKIIEEQRKLNAEKQLLIDEQNQKNAIAKAALLQKLGITEDEAKLLLS